MLYLLFIYASFNFKIKLLKLHMLFKDLESGLIYFSKSQKKE